MEKNILITGGAGFIGSHVVRRFIKNYPNYTIINFDKLTYAGNIKNVEDIANESNYRFVKGDICSPDDVRMAFEKYAITDVIHLAAESHVDRSITNPLEFAQTNVLGTLNLLDNARKFWKEEQNHVFHHVSTDEVYGSLSSTDPMFSETTPYDPRSPYSASKAASDHFVSAYFHTYHLPIKMSNCSNNYGSHHFPEKLIPLIILNIKNQKELPVYGKGDNIRDWLWVEDHASAIDTIFHKGRLGESYNVGGLNEWKNIDVVEKICDIMDGKLNRPAGSNRQLIRFVDDRKGHDLRYAIDATKLETELGWKPSITFEEGLENTIDWYLNHSDWVNEVTSGEYQEYYEKMYGK